MSFGSGYSAAVLADAPLGYWQLGEAEGYAQAVLADGPVGYWRLGDSESYAQAVVRDGVVGYWRLNGDGSDSSGNARHGTVNGAVTFGQPSAFSDGTTAARFDGTTTFVSVPNASALQIIGDLSLEVWFNPAALATRQTLVSKSSGNEFELTIETSGAINFYNQNENVFTGITGLIAAGVWSHIVVTRVVATKTITIYINGVSVKTGTYTTVVTSGTSPVLIGRTQSATQQVNGSIDEVALYNSTLTAAQVANHYALRLSTRSTTAALVATDTTPAGRHGTYIGGVTLAQASPLADGTTAARFDGASGYVNVPNATALQIVGDLTLELWVNVSLAARQTVVAKNSGNEFELVIETTGVISFYNATEIVASSSGTVTAGVWTHIVVTRVVATKTNTIYVNGVSVKVGTYTLVVTSSVSPVQIGRNGGGFQYANGLLDEVALYAYTLSAQQIANHYALRLSMVGAATGYAAGVRADAATGFWRLGEAEGYAQAVRSDAPFVYLRLGESAGAGTAADSSGNARSGTYNAGAAPGSAGALLDGNGAADFSGAANANVTNTNSIGGITVAASFEAFVYADTLTGGVNKAVFSSDFGDTYVVIDGSNLPFASFRIAGVQRTLGGVAALTTGSWWHIVATYDGDKIRLYINGSLVSTSASFVGALGFGSATWRVGTSKPGTEPFDGRIDEFAIYPIALSAQQVATHYALRMSTITTVSVATVADAVAGQTGTVQPGVALGQPGPFPDGTTAALFDGITGAIVIPDAPAQNPGLGSYSYEMWFKRAAGISASEFLICKANGAGNNGQGGELFMGATGFTSRLTAKTVASATVNYADGLWHHVVVSMNRAIPNGGQIYVDGLASGPAVDLTSEAAANLSGSGLDLIIGKRPAGNLFTGAIKDVSIYNTALTAGAVAAHYARGVSALMALDSSPYGRTGRYVGGVTLGQAGAVPVDGAALLDGATGVVSLATAVLSFGTGPMSAECWFKVAANAVEYRALDNKNGASSSESGFSLVLSAGQPAFRIGQAGTAPSFVLAPLSYADNAWHHMVGVLTRGGSDVLTIYVDGVQRATANTTAPGWNITPTKPLWIGKRDDNTAPFYAGLIDEVAVYGYALTAAQVANHYAQEFAALPGSSSSDTEEEDEIYDRLRGFYGSISGSYFVLATDTGTITLVPAVPKHTHFVQRLEVQITTPLAGAVWTLQDGAGAPIAVAPFPASAVGHYVIDLGPQGVPCTEATSLVLSISGGGSGAVGWVAWEGFKQLTLGAAA